MKITVVTVLFTVTKTTTTHEVTMLKTFIVYSIAITILTFISNDAMAILDVLHLSVLIVLFTSPIPMIGYGLVNEGNGY